MKTSTGSCYLKATSTVGVTSHVLFSFTLEIFPNSRGFKRGRRGGTIFFVFESCIIMYENFVVVVVEPK